MNVYLFLYVYYRVSLRTTYMYVRISAARMYMYVQLRLGVARKERQACCAYACACGVGRAWRAAGAARRPRAEELVD